MNAADRAFVARALTCAVCGQPKHNGCQCQPPVLRLVASGRDLREPGDYYVIETLRPPREYFDGLKLRTAGREVDRQYEGLVQHACGTLSPVGGHGDLSVYLANALQELQRGCGCRAGFPCSGSALADVPALLAA
jgi:hypothetical protein